MVWKDKNKMVEHVTSYRQRVRKELIDAAGGKCIHCGYNKSIRALHFDHIDPTTKLASVSVFIRNGRYKDAREEVKKCQLLCANCHAEVEDNRVQEKRNK